MKTTTIIILIIISFISCHSKSQSFEESVVFSHNVGKGELLCYKLTSREWTGKIDFFPESNFESIQKDDRIKEVVKDYQQYILLKRKNDNLIDISIITITKRDSNKVKFFGIDPWDKDENKTIRGIINKNGNIESFYLPKAQKNIFALFFEYPSQPVQINDVWRIEFQMTQISGNFKCKEYSRKNMVTLKEINNTNKDIEAKIDYDIKEKFEGVMNSFIPHSKKPKTEVYSYLTISGTSKYSITKKQLIKSRMIFSYEGKGILEGATTSIQELELMDEIPEIVVKINKK